MLITPLQYTDLSYQVYEKLKEMILSGQLKPGEKIAQEKIASMLGISRMPLHKAFQMLEDEFLVKSIPRRGIFVRKPNLREIMEAFECREGLEGIAARYAATNMPLDQVKELQELFNSFIDSEEVDKMEYQRADQAFHEAIIGASENSVLQRLNSIGNVLIRTYPKGIILPLQESLQDHILILEAIEH
ncbi:MAG: GntR family transcriptional regulator, partial [Bacteroidales bacterium]